MTHYTTDIAIIGAGPVGLFAIFECGMLKLNCHVIDALDEIGGQCTALYPEKPIYDIPAFPKILAGDLIDNLKQQAAPFKPTFHLGQQVTHIRETTYGWEITTSNNIAINAKAIIIAAGVGAFGPNRPPLENLDIYEKNSVFYYIKNKEKFTGKNVVIAGGGDSAVDWALNLADIAKHVHVVHRRAKFRAAPDSVDKLHQLHEDGKITLEIPYQLASLEGEDGHLTGVGIKDLDNNKKILEADVLLPFFGLSMNLGPISEWGLHLDKQNISVNMSTCATSTKGIFAIGDVATYDNKLKLILTGFAEAASAAHAARAHIYPDQVFHFEYSTTHGNPSA